MGRSEGQRDRDSGYGGVERKHIEIYEHLAALNQHCVALAEILEILRDQERLPKRESAYFRLMVEEVRASSSQIIMERLDEHEVRSTAAVSKRRLALEKRLFSL